MQVRTLPRLHLGGCVTIALLDGDAWVYRCGGAAEKTHYMVCDDDGFKLCEDYRSAQKYMKEKGGGTLWSRKEIEPLENCLQMVKTSLENTLNVVGAKEYKLYIGGRRNFRDDIYSDYKANRDAVPKPKYYRDIRDYLVAKWGAVVCEGIEADDAVATLATELGSNKSIIVGVDKDLDQIPGRHYNWVDGRSYTVTPREGLRFFYEQLLSGDTTDNIPGIDGIGPVKASKALAVCTTPQECARTVFAAYSQQAGGSDPSVDIERNASLLWIQRKENDKHPFWKHYGEDRLNALHHARAS
jgi:5'-3' exonuclease